MSFLEEKIPIGQWVKLAVDHVNDEMGDPFRWLSGGLNDGIQSLTTFLAELSPLLLMMFFCLIIYGISRKTFLTAMSFLGLLLIFNQGYWIPTLETLILVGFATVTSTLIGVPVGILAAHSPRFYQFLRPALDLMQTLPTFVYLLPTLMLFGLGPAPGLISTIVFALPAPIRLTQLGIQQVPRPLIEVGQAFGASRLQHLFKIELPHALPNILTGVSQCILLSLSMVVIAALVGADGLGKPVVQALNTVNVSKGFEAGLAIVILAMVLDRTLDRTRGESS